MRRLTTILDTAGAVSVTAGVALIYGPAGFIVGGLGALAISWNLTRVPRIPKEPRR